MIDGGVVRSCGVDGGVGGSRPSACVSAANTRLLVAERGKQMGHREKHISVRSDIRRSLRPIRAAQEVQSD